MLNSRTAEASNLLRLPGRGGAALFLRAGWTAAGWQGLERSGLVLDVSLLDPQRHVRYLARPCAPNTLDVLATFLLSAATDEHPEQSLPDFQDANLGLALSIVQSTTLEVELHVLVVQDPDDGVVEHDGLNFQTSRAVLVSTAQQVRALSEVPQPDEAEDE